MKNCPACGEPNRDDALFCSACGARFPQQDQGAADPGAAPGPEPRNPNYQAPGPQPGYDGQPNYGGPYHGAGAYPPPVEPRSVAICLILSLVTCGIYMLYWMYKVNDELNLLAGNPNGTSGGMECRTILSSCSWSVLPGRYRSSIRRTAFVRRMQITALAETV